MLLCIYIYIMYICIWGFPGGSDCKESTYNAGNPSSIPGSGRSPGEGNDNPFQYSFLENPMDRGAWRAAVHGVAKSWTHFSDYHFHSCVCVCVCVYVCVCRTTFCPLLKVSILKTLNMLKISILDVWLGEPRCKIEEINVAIHTAIQSITTWKWSSHC